MDLIVTDATGKPVASHASYTLDLAFGSGENDFDLQVEDAALKAGSRIMIDGTEYGGIIDDTERPEFDRIVSKLDEIIQSALAVAYNKGG